MLGSHLQRLPGGLVPREGLNWDVQGEEPRSRRVPAGCLRGNLPVEPGNCEFHSLQPTSHQLLLGILKSLSVRHPVLKFGVVLVSGNDIKCT